MCNGTQNEACLNCCKKFENCLQPIEEWITESILRTETWWGYILLLICTIIWCSYNAYICYVSYIGWTASNNIKNAWDPYINEQDLLNDICSGQWNDKFLIEACDEYNDCSKFDPYHRANNVWGIEIALFVCVLLSISPSMWLCYRIRKDNPYSDTCIPCFSTWLPVLGRLICCGLILYYLPKVQNDIYNYIKYCDDTGYDNINIYDNLIEETDKLDFVNIFTIIELVVVIIIFLVFMRMRIKEMMD